MADKKKSPVLAIVTLLTELMNTNFNHLLSTYIILITVINFIINVAITNC